jgi:2-polyprenyl-3-methyl-5-hydroxy-6-metoxy-1,4-benzoquinol methylase
MSKYSREVDLGDSNAADTKIIHLVGKNKKVLEFGCAGGHMSKVLKEKYGCEVVGLEINPEDAEIAKAYCEEIIVCDIEDLEWCEKLSGAQFDVAIFADVLEHLKRPERPLKRVRDFLKKDGHILISVPNIANINIRLELLSGSFEYEDLGILDDTHLKYFTLKSIINLIESAKLYVDSVDYSTKDLPTTIINERLKPLGLRATKKTLKDFSKVEAIAYQFILRAIKKKPESYAGYKFEEIEKPDRVMEKVFQEQATQLREKDEYIRNLKKEQSDRKKHAKSLEPERGDRLAHIRNLEQAVRNYEEMALQKEEELTNLKGQCDDLLNQNEDLKNRPYECREALERIQRHLAYRAYRKIKDLMSHRG